MSGGAIYFRDANGQVQQVSAENPLPVAASAPQPEATEGEQ